MKNVKKKKLRCLYVRDTSDGREFSAHFLNDIYFVLKANSIKAIDTRKGAFRLMTGRICQLMTET